MDPTLTAIREILTAYKEENLAKYVVYISGEEVDEELVSMFAANHMSAGLLAMQIEVAIATHQVAE